MKIQQKIKTFVDMIINRWRKGSKKTQEAIKLIDEAEALDEEIKKKLSELRSYPLHDRRQRGDRRKKKDITHREWIQ